MAKPDWVTLSQSAGTWGLRTINVTVAPNTIYSARTATLTVQTLGANLTENIIINQSAKAATGSMTFNPTGLSYTYEGGILYLHFTANDNWTCTGWPTWIGLSGNDGISGSAGTYTWGVTALQNNTVNDLNSQFTFTCGGNTFTVPVHQDAYQEQTGTTGTISVSPTSITNIASGGSAYTITITSNTGWTITDKPDWVTVSTTGGTGNGAIIVTVSNNSGDEKRTGNITFTTTDNAANASVSLSQNCDYSKAYLTFEILSGGTINWFRQSAYTTTIQYSKNNGEWTNITAGSRIGYPSISVNAGDIVKFRGDNQYYASYAHLKDDSNTFGRSTAGFNAYGNLMSLINSTGYTSINYLTTNYTFMKLFINCTGLTDASNLILPADTLTKGCYFNMFSLCSSLISAPELPATALAENCYDNMFSGCTSLTTAPSILPATTLAAGCYTRMFRGCSSLFNAPIISATRLAEGCCEAMFEGCTSLTTAPSLPATTLAQSCYEYMFAGCTGLTTAPSILPATTLVYRCYTSMFQGCSNLTTAPELPATELVDICYGAMFRFCSNLNYIKCLATNISAYNCTTNWVEDVSSSGTFIKNANMNNWTIGLTPGYGFNGIPENWTVQDA